MHALRPYTSEATLETEKESKKRNQEYQWKLLNAIASHEKRILIQFWLHWKNVQRLKMACCCRRRRIVDIVDKSLLLRFSSSFFFHSFFFLHIWSSIELDLRQTHSHSYIPFTIFEFHWVVGWLVFSYGFFFCLLFLLYVTGFCFYLTQLLLPLLFSFSSFGCCLIVCAFFCCWWCCCCAMCCTYIYMCILIYTYNWMKSHDQSEKLCTALVCTSHSDCSTEQPSVKYKTRRNFNIYKHSHSHTHTNRSVKFKEIKVAGKQ